MTAESTTFHKVGIKKTYPRRLLSKAGIIASFMVGPAEIALSDALFAKIGVFADRLSYGLDISHWAQSLLSKSALLAAIYLESMLIGLAMLRNKQLRGAYSQYEKYQEQRQKHLSKARLYISKIINLPYNFIAGMGRRIEKFGNSLLKSKNNRVYRLGRVIIDIGKTNTMSTTGVVLTELGEKDSTIDAKRVSRLSLIFALCWLPLFIGVQQGYRSLGKLGYIGRLVQSFLGFIGHGLDEATTVNIFHPLQTPSGTIVISLIMTLLAITGWRVSNYLQAKQSLYKRSTS